MKLLQKYMILIVLLLTVTKGKAEELYRGALPSMSSGFSILSVEKIDDTEDYILSFDGGIDHPRMHQKFSEALSYIPTNNFTLFLNSGGGFTSQVKKIKAVFESKCGNNCNVTAIIRSGKECMSACVELFAVLGDYRVVEKGSKMGIHAGFILKDNKIESPRKVARDLISSGLNKKWVKRQYKEKVFHSLEFKILSEADLIESRLADSFSVD